MTFTDKLKAAGFASKAEFGRHIKKHVNTVSAWGEDPPYWVDLYLDLRIRIRELTDE